MVLSGDDNQKADILEQLNSKEFFESSDMCEQVILQ